MRCRWTVPQTRSTKIPSPPEVFWETFSAGGQNQPYGTFLPFLKSLGGTGARGRGNCSQRLTRNPFRRWDRTNRMVRFPLSSKAWEGWGCEERKLFPKTYWEPSPPGGRTNRMGRFSLSSKVWEGWGRGGREPFSKGSLPPQKPQTPSFQTVLAVTAFVRRRREASGVRAPPGRRHRRPWWPCPPR